MSTNNHNSSNDNVDERVVSMRFDNAEFERRTKTTMKTLDKLKAKLNFKGATDSLQKFSRESSKFNLDGVSGAVQACQNKISAWEIAGITAIANITNSAVNAGKKITKALTIEPVFTGFNEYETKINSIQTIMSNTASKGTTMEEVVRVIDELNTYADLTIYNFSEMTRNIGTFTAAGIGLQDAADSIQGIANLAAASGSNSQQASTAMYQLSQALAAGTVKLQDWNSVVNAGMGGELFQNALKQTAREMGIAVDEIIESQGSFRESLSQGWMTADVLSTTLRKFTKKGAKEYSDAMMASGQYTQEMADSLAAEAQNMEDAATKVKTFTQLWDTLKETAQSGWGKTWELIIGNFDEAKELFTNLNDRFSPIIDKMSDARNAVIEGAMGSPSKWEEMIKLVNKAGFATSDFEKTMESVLEKRGMSLEKLVEQYGSLENAFANGPLWSNLAREAIRKMTTEEMKFGGGTMNAAEKLEYFQKVVDDVWAGDWDNNPERMRKLTEAGYNYEAVQDLVNATMNERRLTLDDLTVKQMRAIGYTEEEIKEFQLLKESAHDSNTELYQFIETIDKKSGRELLVQSIYNILDAIGNIVKSIGKAFRDVFSPVQSDDLYSIIEAFEKFTRGLIINEDQMDKLRRTFRGLFSVIDAVKMVLSSGLRLALKIIGTLLGNVNIDFLTLTATIGDALTTLGTWIKKHDLVNKVMTKIGPSLEAASKAIGNWIDKIKNSTNITDDFGKYAANGLIKSISLIGTVFDNLKAVVVKGISNLFGAISFKNIKDNVKNIVTDASDELKNTADEASKPKNLRESVLLYMESLKISVEKCLPLVLDSLKQTFNSATTWFRKNFDPGVVIGSIMIFSLYKTLSKISDVVEMFAKPAEALAGMFESIGGTFDAFTKHIKAMKFRANAVGVLMLAGAVATLAASIYLVSKIPKEDLNNALGAIVIMTIMVTAMLIVVSKVATLSNSADSVNFGAVMGLVGGLVAMAFALKIISQLDNDDINKALNAMKYMLVGLLASLVILILVTKTSKDLNMGAVGIMALGLGTAMILLAEAVKIAGTIDTKTLKQGMAFVAGCGLIMALMIAMVKANGAAILAMGTTIIGMAFAMQMLVGTVLIAGKIEDGVLKQALKVMAAIMVVIVGLTLISKIGGKIGSGISIMGMALAMALMVGIIRYIGTVDMGEIDYANIILAAIATIFVKFMAASLVAGKNAAKAGAMLLQAAVAIGILVGVIWLINKLNMDTEAMKRSVTVVGWLSLFMKMMIKSTKDSQDAKSNIIAAAIAIAVLTGAVYALYFLAKDAKRLMLALLAFGSITAALVLVLKSSKDLDKDQIGPILAVMGGMILLVGMVSALIIGLAIISKSFKKKDDFSKIVYSISSLMAALGIMIYSIGANGKKWKKIGLKEIGKIGLLLVGLSGIIILLAGVLKIVEWINPGASWNQLGKISAVLTLLTGLSIAIINLGKTANSLSDYDTAFWIILGLGGVMIAVAGILTVINMFATASDWSVILQVSVVLVLLSGLAILITKFAGTVKVSDMTGALATIGVLAVVMLVVVWAISLLADVKTENLLTKVTGMIILLGALTICTVVLTNFAEGADPKKMIAAWISMGVLCGCCFLIAWMMTILDDVNAEGIIPKAIAMGTLIVILSAAVVVLQAVGPAAVEALKGVGVLAALLIVIGVVIVAFTKAFQEIVGPGLPALGLQLGLFGSLIQPFVETMKEINGTAVSGCINLMEMFGAITGAMIIDKVIKLFGGTGWTGMVGEQLKAFATAMVEFSDILNDGNIDTVTITAAARIGEMLAALSSDMWVAPEWLSGIIGKQDMAEYGRQLSGFAEGLGAFNEKLKTMEDFDESKVDNFCKAVRPLVLLSHDIPNSGGWLGELVGDNDIDVWGSKLPKFATYISLFDAAIKLTSWDPTYYKNFADCIRPIIELAHDIPNSGGWLGELVGNNDIDKFGQRMPTLAVGLTGFVENTKDTVFNVYRFKAIKECMAVIVEIAKTTKTLSDDLPSESQTEKIASRIQNMVDCNIPIKFEELFKIMTKWNELSGGFNTTKNENFDIEEFYSDIENIGKLKKILPSESESEKISSRLQTMIDSDFTTKFEELAKILSGFMSSTTGIDTEALNNTTSSLKKFVGVLDESTDLDFDGLSVFGETLGTLGDTIMSRFVDAFTGNTDKINAPLTSFINNMNNIFKMNEYVWTINGQHISDNIIKGITNHENKVFEKITEFITSTTTVFDKSNIDFENIGKNYINGMIFGMLSKKFDLIKTAMELSNIAVDTTSTALDIHSPSRVMAGIGEYTVLGFVEGMKRMFRLSDDTAENLGDNVGDILTKMLQETIDIFNDDNFTPTVTPVLDLSLVKSGMSDISSILNGYNPNLFYTGSIQSTTNDDVISAINELNNTLSDLEINNYSVGSITYDEGSAVSNALKSLVNAANIRRRV